MSHILTTVLLISSVLSVVLCENDSKEKQALKKEIKQTKEDILYMRRNNDKMYKEILEEKNQLKERIKVKEELKHKGSAENQAQHKELEDLYRQLAKTYTEEKQLKEAPQNIKKFQLDIKVMNENMKVLDGRRENGMTKECFELEKMEPKTTEDKVLGLIGMKIEDTIVLENQLRLLKSELAEETYRQTELRLRIKDMREFYDKCTKDLNERIERNAMDNKKGQESIDLIKKELEEQKKRLEEFSNSENKNEFEKWREEARKVLKKYQTYNLEIECYKKLYDDVFTLTQPNP